MTRLPGGPTLRLSVDEAGSVGVAGLLAAVEAGQDVAIERDGEAVAVVVSPGHLDHLRQIRDDLGPAALVLARGLTDAGVRTGLDDAIAALGFDRAELEAELRADSASGRP